jgi:hypothetical protein
LDQREISALRLGSPVGLETLGRLDDGRMDPLDRFIGRREADSLEPGGS